MTIQLVGANTLGAAKAGHQPLAARIIVIVVGVAHKIADEVAYTMREDFRHGQISRDLKDWER